MSEPCRHERTVDTDAIKSFVGAIQKLVAVERERDLLRGAHERAIALTATGRLIDPKALIAALDPGEAHE